jgi:hypothetical protein
MRKLCVRAGVHACVQYVTRMGRKLTNNPPRLCGNFSYFRVTHMALTRHCRRSNNFIRTNNNNNNNKEVQIHVFRVFTTCSLVVEYQRRFERARHLHCQDKNMLFKHAVLFIRRLQRRWPIRSTGAGGSEPGRSQQYQ